MDSPATSSAGNATPPVLFVPQGVLSDESSTKAKCNKCESVTIQFQNIIAPTPIDGPSDPLKLLELAKRLIMCSHCGTMRLVN